MCICIHGSSLPSLLYVERLIRLFEAMANSDANLERDPISTDVPVPSAAAIGETPSGTVLTLMPSSPNMTMEHMFFSLQQFESRISAMEAEQTMIKDKVLTTETRNGEMMTRAEIDSRFAQLRDQMSILQRAQQALHAQFQEVARIFHEVSDQWKEQEAVITSMRSLVDRRPSKQAESESFASDGTSRNVSPEQF